LGAVFGAVRDEVLDGVPGDGLERGGALTRARRMLLK
jgi:hypothetical protein